MEKGFKFTLKDLWYIFLIVALPIICVGGASLYPLNLRVPLIYASAIFFVAVFIISGIKIKFNIVTGLAFMFLSFMAISTTYSYDQKYSIRFLILYACAFTLLCINLPVDIYTRIITVMYVFCIVIAFSIILSSLVDNCMLKYFNFIVNPNNASSVITNIKQELSLGRFSGFAREIGEAAYILNVGIAISFAKYFSSGKLKKKDIFFLLSFLVALMLTGKRTLFIICIICFAVFMVVSNIKSKTFLVGYISIIAIGGLLVMMMFFPKIAGIFERFTDSENLETLGHRDMLWDYLFRMISDNWKFGAGFASFNKYAGDRGLTVGGMEWIYYGHNSYLEALGELGIIGFSLLICFIVASLVITFKLIKTVKENQQLLFPVFFSLYIQLMLVIYAVTGNPLYSRQIVFVWFFAISIALSIKNNLISDGNITYKIRDIKGK